MDWSGLWFDGGLGKVELLGLALGAQGWVCDGWCDGCGTLLFQDLLTTTGTKDITKYSTNYTVGNLPKGDAGRTGFGLTV